MNKKIYQRNYQRKYYHSKQLREQRRKAKLQRRHKNKLKAIAFLGGECIKCGNNDPRVLDFHHRNPAEKEANCFSLWHRRWSIIEKEIKKCILLCANCYRIEHYGMLGCHTKDL